MQSLIHWTTQCTYMLIPTEHNADEWMEVMETLAIFNPGDLPGYGPRAWCRLECFIFMLWTAIQGVQRVQLCAVNVEGELIDYPEVNLGDELRKFVSVEEVRLHLPNSLTAHRARQRTALV